jgi:Prophage tail length tape measure protein
LTTRSAVLWPFNGISADVADFESGIKKTVGGVDTIAESSRRLADALAATNETAQATSAVFNEIAASCATMAAAAEAVNQHFAATSNTVAGLAGAVGTLEGGFAETALAVDLAGQSLKDAAVQTEGVAVTSKQAAISLEGMASSSGHLTQGLVETAAAIDQTGRQFTVTAGGVDQAGQAVRSMSTQTAALAIASKQAGSGLDVMATSSHQLQAALVSTNAVSHDVDALFKQITGSCKTMADAAKVLNQSFRDGIVPVNDLNALSERLQAHYAGLAISAKNAGAAIKEVGANGADLTAVNDNAERAADAMGHVGDMTVGAKREIIVLAHEAMTGNFSRMPGSLMVLAERFGTLGMAALRVVGPMAAVGYAAYEITSHAESAAQVLARIEAFLTLSGQAALFTRDGLEGTVAQLSRMHGITKDAAEGIVTEFSRIRSVTPQVMADLTRGMEGWLLVTGEEGPAAAKKLGQSIADPQKMLEELEKQTHAVSAGTMQMVSDLMDSGQVMEAKAAVAREFGDVMERYAAKGLTEFQQASKEAANNLRALGDAMAGTGSHGELLAQVMRDIADALDAMRTPAAIIGKAFWDLIDIVEMFVHTIGYMDEALRAIAGPVAALVVGSIHAMALAAKGDFGAAGEILKRMPGEIAQEWQTHTAEMLRQINLVRAAVEDMGPDDAKPKDKDKGATSSGKANPAEGGENPADREKRVLEILNSTLTVQRELRQIAGEKMLLQEEQVRLEGQLATAPDAEKGKIRAEIADIKEAMKLEDERAANLKKKDGGESVMEGYRRELAEIQAADKRSLEERKADDLAFWKEKLAHLQAGSKDFAQVTMETRRIEKALAADAHGELLADLERQRGAAAKGSADRIAIARQEADEVKRYAGEHSKAYQDALKRIQEMEKEHQKELNRIEAEGIDARASAKKADLETDAENLRFLAAMGVVDEHDKLARLRQIKSEEYQIERDALAEKLKLKAMEATERDRINKQIQQLDQSYRAQDLAASHQQTLAVLHDWQSASSGIGNAFGGAIKGMIVQGQSLQQAERNVALGLANVFADLALKKVGSWLWANGVMKAWSAITAQHDVAQTVAGETAKTVATTTGQAARTGATVAGSATRTAAEASGQVGFLARVGEQLAQWLGLETAKTAETVTESGTRAGAESASVIAGIAAAKAEAAGEIPAFAAIAAAGAMASVACIPYVGWAMAPEVGEETYVDAMSYLPMASAAGGWERVPYDGALTELHKDEMVLPARIADPLRSLAEGNPMGGAMPSLGMPRFRDPANINVGSPANGNASDSRQPITVNAPLTVNGFGAKDFPDLLAKHKVHVSKAVHAAHQAGHRNK